MGAMQMNMKEKMADLIKASGQELIDMADTIVSDMDTCTDISIFIRFDDYCVPTIEVDKTYVGKCVLRVLGAKMKEGEA